MKYTNKKIEALAVKYQPWVIACVDSRGEIYFDHKQLMDVDTPKYIRSLPTFSTLKEAKEHMKTMDQDIGACKYVIVRLGVVLASYNTNSIEDLKIDLREANQSIIATNEKIKELHNAIKFLLAEVRQHDLISEPCRVVLENWGEYIREHKI